MQKVLKSSAIALVSVVVSLVVLSAFVALIAPSSMSASPSDSSAPSSVDRPPSTARQKAIEGKPFKHPDAEIYYAYWERDAFGRTGVGWIVDICPLFTVCSPATSDLERRIADRTSAFRSQVTKRCFVTFEPDAAWSSYWTSTGVENIEVDCQKVVNLLSK